MKKFIISIAAVIMAVSAVSAQQIQNLPNDPATKVGVLDNGMTYYIRHNDKPAQRAEFYLATNVGAIQEAPDQDGLAHFLEHMCFNGTKNFPGKGIINYLESIGASFGGNVNASTGIEQTIYMLTNIPLVRPSVVDSCILIMHDYSHFVLCEDSEIDAERGVIIEEKRSRNVAGWRNYMEMKKYLFRGTPYESVSLIGSQEQLETFNPQSLRNFYHTWYVPCNQALIVVGDIDVAETEAKIKNIFADIPAAENPKQKDVIVVPDNQEPIIGIITDEESTSSEIEVVWKSEAMPEAYNSTPIRLMTDIIKSIITISMNERLNDISSKPGAPFMNASFGFGKLIETMEGTMVSASDKAENILTAFEAVLTEAERLKRYGLSDDEINRAKTEILSQYETAANKADTRKNPEFVQPMIQNFFNNVSFMDPAMQYQLVQMIMQQVSPAVVNQVTPGVITKENMVVIYTGPEKEGVAVPTEEAILGIIGKVENSEIERGAVEAVPEAFLDPAALKGAKIKKSADSYYGSTKLTLANGAEVILLPTDYEKDKVMIQIMKKGGRSLIADEDIYSFDQSVWGAYTGFTGVGQFSQTTMSKMLSGKQVSVQPYINGYTHGLTANSTTKDLETAFQLLYLSYTQPRFDADEFNQGYKQIEAILPQFVEQSSYKLQQEVTKTLYNSPRRTLISQEVLDKASLATIERVVTKQLFNDAAGMKVVIAGDFDKDAVIPMVEKYIGSIKKGKKASDWKFCNDGFVDGKIINEFRTKMTAPKVTVIQLLKTDKPYSTEADVAYSALSYILDMVYVATLREEEGGTYGASS
ncbi:MAG: insulinase family protein, partial [Bacteroidales bacterium]|nr:insulinase family protein [Candidatus Cryptobacteroides equifaecalis]